MATRDDFQGAVLAIALKAIRVHEGKNNMARLRVRTGRGWADVRAFVCFTAIKMCVIVLPAPAGRPDEQLALVELKLLGSEQKALETEHVGVEDRRRVEAIPCHQNRAWLATKATGKERSPHSRLASIPG